MAHENVVAAVHQTIVVVERLAVHRMVQQMVLVEQASVHQLVVQKEEVLAYQELERLYQQDFHQTVHL